MTEPATRNCPCGTAVLDVKTALGKPVCVTADADTSGGTVWVSSLSGRWVAHPLGPDAVKAHRRAGIPLHRTHRCRTGKGRR